MRWLAIAASVAAAATATPAAARPTVVACSMQAAASRHGTAQGTHRPPRPADGAQCQNRRTIAAPGGNGHGADNPGPGGRRTGGGDQDPARHERAWTSAAALSLLLASLFPPVLRGWRRKRRRGRALASIQAEIEQQASRLRIRRLQLLAADANGTVRRDRWEREKRRFCESRLRPVLSRRGLDRLWPALQPAALRRIERAARRGPPGPNGFDPAMHPLDYERFCARLLDRAGWSTRLTPASGDQGADILATRGRVRLVVQCKLYRGAVGNDAVQQVAAARAHHDARAAIVVSNARFTASARALARSNQVALLHHEELAGYRPDRAPSDTIASATW